MPHPSTSPLEEHLSSGAYQFPRHTPHSQEACGKVTLSTCGIEARASVSFFSGLEMSFPMNGIVIYLMFGAWFGITLAVLLGMDVLEPPDGT